MKKFILFLLVYSNFTQKSFAVVKYWIGFTNNWNDPGNWNPVGIPVINDSVYIYAGAANYPNLQGSLEVKKHDPAGTSTFDYTCQYLCLATGARINCDNNQGFIYFNSNGNISGTINMPLCSIVCEEGTEVIETYHTYFSGASIICASYESGVAVCDIGNPIDSYINCYIEGYILLNNASFANCTLAGSVRFGNEHHPNLSGCTIRLMEKYGGFIKRNYLLGGCTNQVTSELYADIVNDSPDDDTLFIFSSPISGPAMVRDFYGNININTGNECARIMIGSTHYGTFPLPCPAAFTNLDSITIHGNVTLQNRGILEFHSPVDVLGAISTNNGHLIKTYPCVINVFPVGDTINCPLNFGQSTLSLSSGNLVLKSEIIADSIINYDASHYLVTLPGGRVTKSVKNSSGNIVFPIGINMDYTPLVIADTSLTPLIYSASVSQGVYTNGNSGLAFNSQVVDRTWNIVKLTSANSSATVTLQWNMADELPGFARNLSSVSHFSGGTWHAGPAGIASGSDPFQSSWSGLNSFSPFAVGSSGLLQFDCLDFKGVLKENAIELSWTVTPGNERNSFTVQRSSDGQLFKDLVVINAGIIVVNTRFSYIDKDFDARNIFYRIYQTDSRGNKIMICNTINVVIPGNGSFVTLMGNPIKNTVSFQFNLSESQTVSVGIYDVAGKLLKLVQTRIKQGINEFQMNTGNLSKGIYLLNVSGSRLNKKIFLFKD